MFKNDPFKLFQSSSNFLFSTGLLQDHRDLSNYDNLSIFGNINESFSLFSINNDPPLSNLDNSSSLLGHKRNFPSILFRENNLKRYYSDDYLDPKIIHFTQDSISNYYRGKVYTVLENVTKLKLGIITVDDIPTIKVFKDKSGKIWTLDNRRLAAFRKAGVSKIPIIWADDDDIQSIHKKLTTDNGGISIKIREKWIYID